MMILRLALRALNREWRAGDLGVVAFALVIATAGVVSVAAFSDRLHQALQSQGTELLGADLIVHTPYPPAAAWQVAAGQRGLTHAQTVAFRSIIIAGEDTQLVEVKAVQSGYPLRGILRVAARTDL